MKYYVLNDLDNPDIDEEEDDAPFLEIHEELLKNPPAGWHSGSKIKDPPSTPIEVEATPHFGYTGPPPDYYDDAISLMSPRLVQILKNAGIDNIEFFRVVITYRGTGEKFDWYAFNALGLVAAVDIDHAAISNPDGAPLINSSIKGFAVDSTKTKQQHFFRLAENVMTLVVSEDIKNAIERAGINTFAFSNPEEWIQI